MPGALVSIKRQYLASTENVPNTITNAYTPCLLYLTSPSRHSYPRHLVWLVTLTEAWGGGVACLTSQSQDQTWTGPNLEPATSPP